MSPRVSRSPRFVVRVLAASFATVVIVLAAVFGVLMLHTRSLVHRSVVENLEASQRLLGAVELERSREAALQAAVLSESPTVKAALDTYQSEVGFGAPRGAVSEARTTVALEVNKLAALLEPDVLAVLGSDQRVIASAGPRSVAWRRDRPIALGDVDESGPFESIVSLDSGETFRITAAPLRLGGSWIGNLVVGTILDDAFAKRLADVARTSVAVVANGRVIASTLSAGSRGQLEARLNSDLAQAGLVEIDDVPYAYRRLQQLGPAAFFALDSTEAAVGRVTHDALPKLAAIAFGGVLLCLAATVWLARTVSAPIDDLSKALASMADGQTLDSLPAPRRPSHEVDTLTETFNRLFASLVAARAEADAAYVGAIRALAAALDARDAYTAGHSERVSALSVAIGEQMGLNDHDREVLRLGALLHDIGKIGISDAILGKPESLTDEEFEVIKTHPTLGAQILRAVPFLTPHLPIVELHHEQPDGRGYPRGLRGEQIPLLARIVHVADAFDAMTTARAYRAGRPAADALAVLWRHAGSQFDVPCVQALSAALAVTRLELSSAHHGASGQGKLASFPRVAEVG